MSKVSTRLCPACNEVKAYRSDCKTCGCQGTKPIAITNDFPDEVARTKEIARLTKALDSARAKTRIKKQVAAVEASEMIRELVEWGKTIAPNQIGTFKGIDPSGRGKMLEIVLTDHHFGKMAWGRETRWPNYDTKIGTQVFHRGLDGILERSPYACYDEIVFVVGNDLFNADDTQGRTTSGTQVESDVRHEKTWVIVRTLIIQAILKLRHFAKKVHVKVIRGNHDWNTTFHLGDLLEVFFENYDDVEIDNRPSSRKYYTFGQTLLGFTHGDKEKPESLPLVMTAEMREEFGKTKFHEWHIGHTHKIDVQERNGIRVRVLPSLCPADAWHSENGYVGNLRSTEAFIWDKDAGLIGTIVYVDDDKLIEEASTVPSAVRD